VTGEYTVEDLRVAVSTDRPLVDLEERETKWVLGGISISRSHPWFSYGYKANLRHDSHFRKQRFSFPDLNKVGLAIIFRAWETGDEGLPEEFFAGWVPEERESDAISWIKFLNQELRWRLVEKRERDEQRRDGISSHEADHDESDSGAGPKV
jgi:hypothetical protein